MVWILASKCTDQTTLQNPNHSESEHQNILYLNVFGIQMLGIQAPSYVCYSVVCKSYSACKLIHYFSGHLKQLAGEL